ncbi:protein piccolo isoform 2-T2 [Anableps anableps]
MGNEASLEGGEGPPSGLPEGLAPDGKGGFVRVSDGTPVNLSELSEDERRQLAAAMSRAQGRQPGAPAAPRRPSESDAHQQVGTSRGPAGLSKSRTVDAFNQGPPGKPTPGRSPSSLSLFESRFRQEPKGPETKSSGMFGSSFLSGANPLSAVSSMTSSITSMGDAVNIPKFGLFGDEEEEDAAVKVETKQGGKPPGKGPQQGQGPKGPQQAGPPKQSQTPSGQGPKPAQGPPGQGPKPGQGPLGQGPRQSQGTPGQGPKSGHGPPGPGPRQSQGPKSDQGPSGQAPRQSQGPAGQGQQAPRPDHGGPHQQKGGPPQQGPGKPGPKLQGQQGHMPAKGTGPPSQQVAGKPAGGLCPLCKTTQLNTGSKDSPNYNTCTECKNQVCSLCGFSPPDSAGKEWLCLNCQMQRAMGGMDPPGISKPMQGSGPPSPQRQASGKPGKLLIKQQSTSDQGLTPPTTPRQKSPGPSSPGPLSPGSSLAGSPKIDPKTGRPILQKSSPQQSPAKAKQESSFFGGLGGISLGGFTDSAKPPAAAAQGAESVTGKLFSGFGGLMESSKPPTQAAPKQDESVAGKLFGGLGGLTESAKPPAAASQMFSFGSSLLSSATTLVSGEETKAPESPPGSPDSGPGSPPDSDPGSPPDSPFSAPGSPPDSDSAPDTPPGGFKKPPRHSTVEQEEKSTAAEFAQDLTSVPKGKCPLCDLELNIGSSDNPNYSLCTECKKNVCNLCGFNPNPHLGEKEWLCLNCQTQKAMSGQLGDIPPPSMASPKKQEPAPPSVPSSTPVPTPVDNKPVAEAIDPTPPAPEIKVANAFTPDSPEHTYTPIENIHQEAPDSEELKQSLADESMSDRQLLNSESLAEISSEIPPVENKQLKSENIPQESPHPDTELPDTNQQTQSTTVSEILVAEEQQSSCEKAAENCPQSDTQILNVEPQAQCPPAGEIPVAEQQDSSENRAESLSPTMEDEAQNPSTNAVLDNTAASVEVETRPDTKITQSEGAALPEDHKNIESTPEKLPEATVEPAASMIHEGVTQELPPVKPNSTAADVNKDNICKVLTDEPQTMPVELTPSDTTLEINKTDFIDKSGVDTVAPVVTNDITAEIMSATELITSVNPPVKVKAPATDNTGQELQETIVKSDVESEISLVMEDKNSFAASGEVSQVTETKNELIEKEEEPDPHNLADGSLPVVAPLEKETDVPENANKGNIDETKDSVKVVDNKEIVVDKTPEKDDEVVGADPEINVGTAEAAEVKLDEGKSLKDERIIKETVENTNDQNVLRKHVDEACLIEAVSNDAESILMERKEVEKKSTAAVTVPEEIPKEDVQINKDIQQETKSEAVEGSPVKTVPVLKKSEEKEESLAVAEDVSETGEQSLEDTTLKVDEQSDKTAVSSDPPSVEPRQQEMDVFEVPVKSLQSVSTSADVTETNTSNKTYEEKDFESKEVGGLSATKIQNEPEKVVEPSVKDREAETDKIEDESQPVVGSLQEAISVSKASALCDKDCNTVFDVEESSTSEKNQASEHVPAVVPSIPLAESEIQSVVSEHDAGLKEESLEEKMDATAKPVEKHGDDDAFLEIKQEDTLKQPELKEVEAKEGNLMSSSDLAKLESSVLPILKAQANTEQEEKQTDTLKIRRKLEVLPLSPDSPSSEEDKGLSEKNAKSTAKKKLLVPMDIKADSLDDSSESFGKESPISGDDEEFIRKQIIEMSENEDASPSDEESLVRRKIREDEKKQNEEKKADTVEKSTSGKTRRLTKKTTISPDDEDVQEITASADKSDAIKRDGQEEKEEEHQSIDALRKLQSFELNVTSSPICIPSADGEPEMESLTDSPDDRSRGEGSSSLHASSFTPGTSPTSLSSMDEDSDSSSPSHVRTGEGKQHRKAKHRQTGQMLPTIEDSSEEEELREEEELLREQEKQKGSGKKSKKDKDEIRAQRRREHTKTPPSNLSPIEDASPTEEQRQEAEMEEIRRSSCSDFSPSIESDPEGFEIHAAKIAAVQKTYQLPISVSLHSPTDDQNTDKSQKKALKSADEAYEEIMLRAKSPTVDKGEIQAEKESVYGNMLIEDYVYPSLLDNSFDREEAEKISVPVEPKKLRSPDEVYEDMIKKRKEFMQLEQEYENIKPKNETPNPKIVLQPAENTFPQSTTVTLGKDGKPLLDAEAAYEELMKRVLTPGTSPTQPEPEVETTSSKKVLQPIPDLKVTQCSSGELSSDDESTVKKEQAVTGISDMISEKESEPVKEVSEAPPSTTTEQQPDIENSTSQAELVDLSSSFPRSSPPVIANVSPLPTVPQYTPSISSVVSTAPPVPPKPNILRRANSQEKGEEPVAPPQPPPTPPKPTVFPRKAPIPLPPQASVPMKKSEPVAMTSPQGSPVRQAVTPTYKPHIPPPVPPKPAIHGIVDSHRSGHGVKPPIAPKPGSQSPSPAHAPLPTRPTVLPTCPNDSVLNLSPSAEGKTFQPSPKSPSSPRYASNLRDTYVVITLPSQPSSPVDSVTTQAPSGPRPASPSKQAQHESYCQPQPQHSYPQQHQQPTPPPQTTRVPLAYTRVTESIEKQEICSPEKHVSSSCHIIEAISASAQPSVMPNLISQVVTTEVQRTTVSVVHERTPPPVPAPRATGVPMSMEKPKSHILAQTETTSLPSEVVDLRTVKVDSDSNMNGVDLSTSPDSRRQSFVSDVSRHTSAVQSPVVNLSTESSTVSIVTDSITIVTCSATIQQCDNVEISEASSVPLQLTKNKSFEPVSQIIYRPVESQPSTLSTSEIPINLSVGSNASAAGFQSMPVTVPLPSVATCVANGLTTGRTTVAGAVDLSTSKPFNTVVSVDVTSADVVTTIITDDGKPVDLTAGKRAVCCDVVYKLPFAGSCATQQPTTPLPEDRFGYRDDHYQFDRTPYGMRGFGGIKPSMSDTNLAEAGLFMYKSKNSYNFSVTTEGAVDLTSTKISDTGEAVDYSKKGSYAGMTIPPYSHSSATSAVSSIFGTSSVLRSSNGVVYSSVAAPVPTTYAITTQPGSIFSTTYNTFSGMHTSDTMPSLSNLQNLPLTRSQSFLSTISTTEEQGDAPLNLEISKGGITAVNGTSTATSLSLDTYTDASLEAIAASLEALSSPMVPGDGQYQAERERLEMEKLKQQRLAEELEWERQNIQRFREQEQLLVQKELEELQAMKQQILAQQEEERQAHLMMQKETYAQQQQQLEQIQRLQEQLRLQLEEQKLRQMYPGTDIPGHGVQEAIVLGPDGTVLSRKITDSGCQTDEEDEALSKAYTAGRKKKNVKKSVDSCVQTDDEDQEEWEAQRSRQSRPRTARGDRGGQSEMSLQAHTEISIQTDTDGNIRMDTRMELSDSERTSPKKRPTHLTQSANLKPEFSSLQAHPKSPKVLYSPISPCISPSKSLEFVSYDKSLGDTSPQKLRESVDPSKSSPASPRGSKTMQRSMSDPKPMSPTGEERATSGTQYGDSHPGKGSGSTPTGTQKKVKRTLPNPPSEEESTTSGQTAYTTNSARRRMCRNSNMARAKILQDIDRELDLVERESSKLRKRQAELDEEEKEIDAKLRYLEMGINRRKDALLKEREKRERAYLQSVAEDRDYMSDSEVSNIRETRSVQEGGEDEDIEDHLLERPRTAPHSELDDFVPPQTKHEYGKYSQYQYPQSQYEQSIYQTPQSYQSHSIYSSVPSLTTAQQQSYQQMLLLQQKAARQAALLSELDATKYDVISRQPDPTSSAYLGVKYDKYGNHLDLRALEVGSIAGSPMSAVSDSYYTEVEHHTPRSYMLLEDAAELAKTSTGLSSSYSLAERELAKAEKLLRRSAADLGSTDYLGSTSRLHTFGKTPDEEDTMEEPYELKLLKQQLKQEFRRSTGGTESLEQLTGLSQNYYTPSSGVSSYSQRHYPKSEKYSISRLTLEKQAAKQLPASVLYQKHKTPILDPKISSKYSSITDNRGLETDYNYLGSTSASPRSSRLLQDEITFGLRKNIAEQQKYLGSTLGANLAGSLNLGQSLGLDSAYPSGSRSRPSSRPTSCYGLDLSIKRDLSSSSLRLKGDGESSGDAPSYQTPSGRTKPTSLPIVQSGRGRIPIVAQNSEEESPLSPVGQPMGMARASAGPLPPISADSRDQFGSCMSLQDSQQQQHIREEPTRGRSYVLLDDLQGTMSDSEALSDSLMALNRDDATNAYHLRRDETDWFDKPRDGRPENGQEKRQGKGPYYPFPHLRVKLQRDLKDRSVTGNGLGIRVVGGKDVPGGNGDIGAYVAKVLPGGAAEQTGKILEGMQVLEWNGVPLMGKTYEEVQGLVGQLCNEAELCVRLDLNMLAESEDSQHLDLQEPSKGEKPPRSPGVDPKQLAAELQKVSQQQGPMSASSSSLAAPTSSTSSPGQPGSPSVSKKRHTSKTTEGSKTHSHPISGEIQLQIHYDKQLGNLIVHVLQARNLAPRDNNGYSDPFVKVYLLPGRGAENKRKSKHAGKSINPEWNQTVIYKNIHLEQLRKKTLEVSVWDYDKGSSNDFLGEVLIDLSNTAQLDNMPRWLPLKEQSEGDHHRRSHSGQGRHGSSKPSSQHSSPKITASTHDSQDSPKSSVTKSRSHGIFPDPAKARSSYRSSDAPVTAASLDSGLSGSAYSLLDEEGETNEVDSAIFQVPRFGKIPNGTDVIKSSMGPSDGEGKTQVMGEIKIALKREMRTEGEHLVLEILQCRNITYKFKTPDHLPDLYVKLYVVNIATQKRIIKKKTRVCRHDREPSFNETFRFCMNPTGHSLQLFLVSNGGKFIKKTLIGEAYVWLDKIDLRKRVVSWHKLLTSTAQIHS